MKKNTIIGIIIVCVFLMGYMFGAYQKNETSEYTSVPQHQL